MNKPRTARLGSIDAARGFAMFLTIGGTELLLGLAHMTGHPGFIGLMTAQMRHTAWHGLTLCDLIFPFFLLISGMTFPLSLKKHTEKGTSRTNLHLTILRRAVIMILLGLVYNGLLKDADYSDVRVFSVLARLGVAWAAAAVISMHIKRDWQWALWFALPLLAYWLILATVSAPDAPGFDSFSMEGNIAGYIDRTLFPGHIYNPYYDPEGLLGYIPSVSTALLGMAAGSFVTDTRRKISPARKALYILLAGIALLGIGLLWNLVFPINKRLWTSSFVCTAGGIGLLVYDLFYVAVDIWEKTKWVTPFTALGMNSIAAYLAYHFIDFSRTGQYLFGWAYALAPENWTIFLDRLIPIAILWIFFGFLYKKKVAIKI